MGYSQLRQVLPPKRRKMYILADLASSVHLDCLAFQFGKLQLNQCAGIVGWDLELQLERISDKVMNVGDCSFPLGAIFLRRQLKPVIIFAFVLLDVHHQCLVFFLQSLSPLGFVLRSCMHGQDWDLLENVLNLTLH